MSPSGHKATVDGHISAMIRGRDQCSDTKRGCVKGQSLKGKGGYIRDGTATLPVTKICTSPHISMDQTTISKQTLSMLYMNVS